MSKKITLEIRENGFLYDANGLYVGLLDEATMKGFEPESPDEKSNTNTSSISISAIARLKKEGFSTDDIVKLHQEGLLK